MTKLSQAPNLSGKVKVAVRLRPFNKRETDLNTQCVVDMKGDQTYLVPAEEKHENRKQAKTFTFDHCFWSMDSSEREKFSDQEQVFKSLGIELLDNAFSGYNACIFAYGQTGSGKSYTMMGGQDQPGLIPRLCDALFDRIHTETKQDASFKVEVSYMEIYNEKVRDLLDPSGGRQQLKVREHKLFGPYVDGLQQLLANSANVVQEFMSQGSKSRTVAATKMNAESSRSHAVFTLIVTHTILDLRSGVSGERVSKLSLVDLAGSERSSKTGASGARLKEGSNINKSLTTLGLVISALADQSSGKNKNKFVPYRDSTLTWILKDNLGGNSKTTMVATLSPSADNYEETLSTLRYADRAKRIVNKAVVNEDPNARIIRELREEVEKLQTQLKKSESMRAPDLNEKLRESEKLIQTISQTWEEKLRKTELIHKQRQETLEKMGISLADSGIKLEKAKCFLVNLNADPSLNELLVYYLKPLSLVGQSAENDIQLSGLGISSKHAEMRVVEEGGSSKVTVTPLEGARTCVNGRGITATCHLRHGDRILWGNNHFFRINIPRSSKREEEGLRQQPEEASTAQEDIATKSDNHLTEALGGYELAQQEVLLNQADAPLQETLTNLEREFQRLQKEGNSPYKEMSESISLSKLDAGEREKYEQEIDSLRRQVHSLAPPKDHDLAHQSTLHLPLGNNGMATAPAHGYHNYRSLKEEREKIFQTSISQLRRELVRAQTFAGEANALALEMGKKTEFTVTLRIPAHNLTPNRKHGMLLCEPAIQVVRDGKESKVWSVENLSNKLVEMRDMYETYKQVQEDAESSHSSEPGSEDQTSDNHVDPFTETNHGQVLIGVANVFLTCLLQDAPLHYPVPIINQQGQVAGKLLVGIHRVSGHIPEHMIFGGEADESSDSRDTSGDVELDEDSSTSGDVSTDLEEDSDSSMSSGVGSSLSTDPPELSRNPESNRVLDASTGSLSSVSVPVTQSTSFHTKRRRSKAMPQMTCKVTILEAQSLPVTFSHYVECQYTFLDCPDVIVVPPDLSPSEVSPKRRSFLNIRFNFSMEFTCNITEELVDRLASNTSLAIEVWGHKDRYHKSNSSTSSLTSSSITSSSPPVGRKRRGKGRVKHMDPFSRGYSLRFEKTKSLKERWNEVVKRLRVEVSIQELADTGTYEPVEVATKPEVQCIGTFQLKQGQSRRMHVKIEPNSDSGSLPLICESIASVYAGSIHCKVASEDRGLDSYQDRDLTDLRQKWQRVLDRRKSHLDKQIKDLSKKENKTELEREREHGLLDQWVALTEERNAVLAPTSESGVPGAPASWLPPPAFEMHVPVIYLDLDSEPVGLGDVVRSPAGLDSELPLETPGTFVQLPFVRPPESDFRGVVSSLVSWDSSMHDTVLLNRVTPSNERIYVVVKPPAATTPQLQTVIEPRSMVQSFHKTRNYQNKIHVRLSHPVEMDLVLRKRICVSVYKQKGFAAALKRKMQGKPLLSSGVAYDIISNIPLATAENEDQESLAMLAASGAKAQDEDKCMEEPPSDEEEGQGSYFEKYVMRATRAVDDILTLDRIRQEVALRDALARDSSLSPNRGVDVVSIISKRNKSRASSVFSHPVTPSRTPESNFSGSR